MYSPLTGLEFLNQILWAVYSSDTYMYYAHNKYRLFIPVAEIDVTVVFLFPNDALSFVWTGVQLSTPEGMKKH